MDKLNGSRKFLEAIAKQPVSGIIDGYTREAGVRNLERTITSVLRKCARKIASMRN